MLSSACTHLGNDVFLGLSNEGVVNLFDQESAIPYAPVMGLTYNRPWKDDADEDETIHPSRAALLKREIDRVVLKASPDGEAVLLLRPNSLRHRVLYPNAPEDDIAHLNTLAPVVSVAWHPTSPWLLLLLTSTDVIEVFDVQRQRVSCLVTRTAAVVLQKKVVHRTTDAGRKRSQTRGVTPSVAKDKDGSKREGSPPIADGSSATVNIPYFAGIATVPPTTAAPPLILLLAGDSRGHVLSYVLEEDGTFNTGSTEPGQGEVIFRLEPSTESKGQLSGGSPVAPLSVYSTLIDPERGLFALCVLRSDGTLHVGYLKERAMRLPSSSQSHPVHVLQLFHPVRLPTTMDPHQEFPMCTIQALMAKSSAPSDAKAEQQQKQPKRSVKGHKELESKKEKKGSKEESSSAVSLHLTSTGLVTSGKRFHFSDRPEGQQDTFLPENPTLTFSSKAASCHGLQSQDTTLLISVASGSAGMATREEEEEEDYTSVLVALPYWSDAAQHGSAGWIADPLLRLQNAVNKVECPRQLPALGGDRSQPPAPLAVCLPLHTKDHWVALGSAHVVSGASDHADVPVGQIDGETVTSFSPLWLQQFSLLSAGITASLAHGCDVNFRPMDPALWETSQPPGTGADDNEDDPASGPEQLLSRIGAVHEAILAKDETFGVEAESDRIARKLNEIREALGRRLNALVESRTQLQQEVQMGADQHKENEVILDRMDAKLTTAIMARNGVPSLAVMNERFGDLHEALEALDV